ncbi:hypothetical protein TAL182_PB00058 (plasmid) [Rhizobium sp. TAL182]|nr:hypothetical protein TAL182_PB00058 [Rhizobium sp. TAL182]
MPRHAQSDARFPDIRERKDTSMKRLTLAMAAVAVVAAAPAFAAEGKAYLPPQTAAAIIANGMPWSAEAPNGRNFKLTLNKDGTGNIKGPLLFQLTLNWAVKGDAMCICGTMMSKCLRFREIPDGLQAWDGEKPDLKLTH